MLPDLLNFQQLRFLFLIYSIRSSFGFYLDSGKCCFTWKVCLGLWILGREEVNGTSYTFASCTERCCGAVLGLLGVKEEWTRVSQREQSLRKADKVGMGICVRWWHLAGGGGMASDDLMDVDAGGMAIKDKGKPIAVAGGKRE
eukprot:g18707.t1